MVDKFLPVGRIEITSAVPLESLNLLHDQLPRCRVRPLNLDLDNFIKGITNEIVVLMKIPADKLLKCRVARPIHFSQITKKCDHGASKLSSGIPIEIGPKQLPQLRALRIQS
ncbi:hypothetical protein [Cupriavidus campinensis]|nr:hypothetical protein [Cupriavidus campinensis]